MKQKNKISRQNWIFQQNYQNKGQSIPKQNKKMIWNKKSNWKHKIINKKVYNSIKARKLMFLVEMEKIDR